jgi:mannose-6-phosphate isomerase-like protein (cupin superfamily)
MGSSNQRRVVSLEDVEWDTNETLDPAAWPQDRVRWKTLISEELTGSKDLLFGVAELDPGDAHGLHDHPDSAELYYVLQGSARVVLGDEEFDASPGTAVYTPARTKHEIRNTGTETLVFVWAFNKGSAEPDSWDQGERSS